MMNPINRIPQNSEHTLIESVEMEMPHTPLKIADAMRDAITHDQSDDHLGCMLDWAMQIRAEFGFDWASCIGVAMTLYFG